MRFHCNFRQSLTLRWFDHSPEEVDYRKLKDLSLPMGQPKMMVINVQAFAQGLQIDKQGESGLNHIGPTELIEVFLLFV